MSSFEARPERGADGKNVLVVEGGQRSTREAGGVEAVSDAVPVTGGDRYLLTSTLHAVKADPERGVQQRIFWLDSGGKTIETGYGGEKRVRRGRTIDLESSLRAPKEAVSAKVVIGSVVSSREPVVFWIDSVRLRPAERK